MKRSLSLMTCLACASIIAAQNNVRTIRVPGVCAVSMSGKNAYYQNDAGKTFADATWKTFGRTPWGAMGLKFFDRANKFYAT